MTASHKVNLHFKLSLGVERRIVFIWKSPGVSFLVLTFRNLPAVLSSKYTPMKMKHIESSETSAIRAQTPENTQNKI